jgi:hypothetical protein
VSTPYFLATKLEAFDGRGRGNYLQSHDMEDIALLNGRPQVVDEVRQAPAELRAYLVERFDALLNTRAFIEALSGHLPPDTESQARLPLVIGRITAIAESAA